MSLGIDLIRHFHNASFKAAQAVEAQALITILAVLVSLPLIILLSLIVVIFARSIVARLALWCAALIIVAVGVSFALYSRGGNLTSSTSMAVIVSCITVILFYCWNRLRPIMSAEAAQPART
jgi:uncharacterized membrane protein